MRHDTPAHATKSDSELINAVLVAIRRLMSDYSRQLDARADDLSEAEFDLLESDLEQLRISTYNNLMELKRRHA